MRAKSRTRLGKLDHGVKRKPGKSSKYLLRFREEDEVDDDDEEGDVSSVVCAFAAGGVQATRATTKATTTTCHMVDPRWDGIIVSCTNTCVYVCDVDLSRITHALVDEWMILMIRGVSIRGRKEGLIDWLNRPIVLSLLENRDL